jgi:hypothetical protein
VSSVPGRPSIEDVALLLRARTKDSYGNEVGTFDDDTRPTGDQVEEQIDAALALVCTRLPALDELDPDLLPAVASVVAYRAALRVEKSYFPEQVRSDRSAYEQLYQEYLDDLGALVDASTAGGEDGVAAAGIGVLPVGSWTSIPGSFIYPPSPDEDAA